MIWAKPLGTHLLPFAHAPGQNLETAIIFRFNSCDWLTPVTVPGRMTFQACVMFTNDTYPRTQQRPSKQSITVCYESKHWYNGTINHRNTIINGQNALMLISSQQWSLPLKLASQTKVIYGSEKRCRIQIQKSFIFCQCVQKIGPKPGPRYELEKWKLPWNSKQNTRTSYTESISRGMHSGAKAVPVVGTRIQAGLCGALVVQARKCIAGWHGVEKWWILSSLSRVSSNFNQWL